MTLDHAVALSLVDDLPRVGLTDRLLSDDPELVELATAGRVHATEIRQQAAARGIGVLGWNDPRFPVGLLATTDCPPALWYRGDLSALNAPGDRHRRVAGGIGGGSGNGGSPRRRPRRVRDRGGQRPGAWRRLRRASWRAPAGTDDRRPRFRRRSHLSRRTSRRSPPRSRPAASWSASSRRDQRRCRFDSRCATGSSAACRGR